VAHVRPLPSAWCGCIGPVDDPLRGLGRELLAGLQLAEMRRHLRRRRPISDELPSGTIIASFSHSECNACRGGCVPSERNHLTRLPGYSGGRRRRGCRIEFTHISTPSSLPQSKAAAQALRPDLDFVEFPRRLNVPLEQ